MYAVSNYVEFSKIGEISIYKENCITLFLTNIPCVISKTSGEKNVLLDECIIRDQCPEERVNGEWGTHKTERERERESRMYLWIEQYPASWSKLSSLTRKLTLFQELLINCAIILYDCGLYRLNLDRCVR